MSSVNSHLRPSDQLIDFLHTYESGEDRSPQLTSYQDIAKVWTIGFGHTGPEVGPDMTISKEEAYEYFRDDLAKHSTPVNRLVTVPLTQHQYNALVSFVYNLGEPNFRGSKLLRLINSDNFTKTSISEEFAKWHNYTHPETKKLVPSDGLKVRRYDEAKMFTQGDYNKTPIDVFRQELEQKQNNNVTSVSNTSNTYTIQSGDTLGEIAEKYGTTAGVLRQLNPQITNADQIKKNDILRLPEKESSPQKSGTDRSSIKDKWLRVERQIDLQFSQNTQSDDLLTDTKRDIEPDNANDMAHLVAQFRAVEIASRTQNPIPKDVISNQSNSEEQEHNANGGDSQGTVEEAIQADAPNTKQSEQYTPDSSALQEQIEAITKENAELLRKHDSLNKRIEGLQEDYCQLLLWAQKLETKVENMPKRIEQIQEHRRRFPLGNIWDYPNFVWAQ